MMQIPLYVVVCRPTALRSTSSIMYHLVCTLPTTATTLPKRVIRLTHLPQILLNPLVGLSHALGRDLAVRQIQPVRCLVQGTKGGVEVHIFCKIKVFASC